MAQHRFGDVISSVPPYLSGTYVPVGRSVAMTVNPAAVAGANGGTQASPFAPGGAGGSGFLQAVANEGAGTGLVYASTSAGGTAFLRTLQADPAVANAGIAVTTDETGNVIDIGNTLQGANLGAGHGLYSAKTANELQFVSLTAGSNVVLVPSGDGATLQINATSPISATSIQNEGAGAGLIYDTTTSSASIAYMRTLQVDPNPVNSGIAIAVSGLVINIGNTVAGSNIGTGGPMASSTPPRRGRASSSSRASSSRPPSR